MNNTFGENLRVTLFGESHGAAVGAVVDGLAPGIKVDEDTITRFLSRRRPRGSETARREKDEFSIVSGVFRGFTTGTPLTILLPNTDVQSGDYTFGAARPSHADFAAHEKYHGVEDYRGGGHFSGRVTAALVAVGGILIPALSALGIRIGTHILRCGRVTERGFDDILRDVSALSLADFPALEGETAERIEQELSEMKKQRDSIGGVTETAVTGLPTGVGEPWFDSVEGVLSHALFSIGGVKGVEFGDGFALANMRGSKANDPLRAADGKVYTTTNRNGGVNGGITNGMPVVFRCAVKPTPSIGRRQDTVDLTTLENTEIEITGRHDPAIVRRVCPVIDAVTAIALGDLLVQRYGTDYLAGGAK